MVCDVMRLKELEKESIRLKRIFAELCLEHTILKDVISKKAGVLPTKEINSEN